MTKRALTEEEKEALAVAMQDVKPLEKKHAPASPVPAKPAAAKKAAPNLWKQKTLDLHGFTLQEAYGKLMAFVTAHALAGSRDLLVITGKSGPLARDVPRWLAVSNMKSRIIMVAKAKPEQGGEGALIVRLKQKRK